MSCLRIRKGLIIRDIGDEVVAYDSKQGVIYVLNFTAGTVLLMCDGRHSTVDIINEMLPMFSEVDSETLSHDVNIIVEDFIEKGLVDLLTD